MGRSNAAHEPSMEEILASIRKIIESGDERPGEGVFRPRASAPDGAPLTARQPIASAAPNEMTDDVRGRVATGLAQSDEADLLPAVRPDARQVDPAQSDEEPDETTSPPVSEATDHFFDLDFSDLKIELEQEFVAKDHHNDGDAPDREAPGSHVEPVSKSEPAPRSAPQPLPVFDDERRGDASVEAWTTRSDGRHAALRAAATVAVDRQAAAIPRFEPPATPVSRPLPPAATVAAEPLPQALSAANSDDRRMGDFRSAVIEDAGRLAAAAGPQLLSERSGEMVGASFEELTRAIREGQLRSMEEMAEDLMRPMLQEWLDDNLPKLVERLVREEIERVARGGR